MADHPTNPVSKRARQGGRASGAKDQNAAVFADQIVQTREAVDKARELLKGIAKPSRDK